MGTEKGAREEGERRGRRNIQAGETSCPSPAFTGPSNLLLAPETSSQLWLPRQSFPPPLVSPSLSFLQGQAPRTAHLLEGSQVPLRLRPPKIPKSRRQEKMPCLSSPGTRERVGPQISSFLDFPLPRAILSPSPNPPCWSLGHFF